MVDRLLDTPRVCEHVPQLASFYCFFFDVPFALALGLLWLVVLRSAAFTGSAQALNWASCSCRSSVLELNGDSQRNYIASYTII